MLRGFDSRRLHPGVPENARLLAAPNRYLAAGSTAGSCLLESADEGTAFRRISPTRLRNPVPPFASLAWASVLSLDAPAEGPRQRMVIRLRYPDHSAKTQLVPRVE